ncbi:LPXTG cell wall anchor domain-containing protein, partial [Lactobacillus mulieris]
EKNQVAENIKNANGDKHIADVEVKDNGRTIVTFEDGTQKELDRSETISYPDHTSGEALTFNDAQADQSLNNFDKVSVSDPDNLTDSEKNQVAENIKNANSDKHIADVEVKDNGRTIVTFEDGTQKELDRSETITYPDHTLGEALTFDDAQADQSLNNFDKISVSDPDNLTDSEKNQVAENIKKSNSDKHIADVEVKDNGRTIITFEDGTQKELDRSETITYPDHTSGEALTFDDAQADQSLNSFDKVEVSDPDKLTGSEKNQVAENIKNANSDKHIADVEVKDNGRTIITFEDGTQKELDRNETITYPDHTSGEALTFDDAQAEQSLNDFDKVSVSDPDNLTDSEKSQVAENIKKSNSDKHIADVEVKDNGRTIITFEDGTQKELDRSETITYPDHTSGEALTFDDAQAEQSLNDFDKVSVSDPDKLTDSEKNQVAENIKKSNGDKHIADVEVKDNGRTIITFEDGTQKELTPAQTIVEKLTETSVNKDDLKKEVAKKDQIHTSVAYVNGSAVNKKAYDEALAKAEAVLADENASQEDVDAALAGLISASQKLDGKESPATSISKSSITIQKEKKPKLETNQLPQTGSKESTASAYGLGIVALAFALLGFKKKKDEE